jgi:hypothetical protein
MNIHQVCVNYVNEQDRLLVRINTRGEEEVRLWFTRRLTLGLLPLLEKAANDQLSRQASPIKPASPLDVQRQRLLDNFKQEAAAYQTDFATPYREKVFSLPLGAEPLLVTEVTMTPLTGGEIQLDLFEKFNGKNRNLHVKMDLPLANGLVGLINQALGTTRWLDTEMAVTVKITGAKSQGQAEPLAAMADMPDMDADLEAEKPRYLN